MNQPLLVHCDKFKSSTGEVSNFIFINEVQTMKRNANFSISNSLHKF